MKIKLLFVLFIMFILTSILSSSNIHFWAHAEDELDKIGKQIGDLTIALNMSLNATRPLESELNNLSAQIKDIKARVLTIDSDISEKKKNIDKGYADIAIKEKILHEKIRDFYVKSYYNSPFLIFLSSSTATDITQALAYQKATEDQDKIIITDIVLSVTDLESKKIALEDEAARLKILRANLDEQSSKLNTIVIGAKAYQASLNTQIAELSTKQQELLAQKYASLGISLSAYNMTGGCKSDLIDGKDPGFSPKFGFFSYGVPNRVGLNQFGAKGRAEAGQNYQQILSSYYNSNLTSGYNQSVNIHITGTNDYGQSFDTNWNIEDYLKHIYEIPASWPQEALKAQAIAARSYALAYTNNGGSSICPDQHCQEVKQELNSQPWIDAVNATAGQVLTSNNQPIKAWFSSTHGGYVFTSGDIGWNATDFTKRAQDSSSSINSFSDLQNNAYDKSSPWFYCDWGSRSSGNNTAWLKGDEIADIINVITPVQADSSTKEHLYQTDKSNPSNTDNWDSGRVKDELQKRNIVPFNNINNISVNADFGIGKVTTVTANGDSGSKNFSGDFFKTYFNLRAPANIQIVGPLYNIEQR